ncbi:iron ABC transporter permease [Rhizobium sp. L1K21]|uniref:FecCD family ABC transporter permease n=1 Tax=Rhizobium sp. L1K21 TaxID=2954933 RepID=UPI002092EDD8|nr:iron ABC transporter permease [Rhizobium sp. L1K21]MCO6188507.1 iron ABC transporter permease [Rhizobium sp. L1K21]
MSGRANALPGSRARSLTMTVIAIVVAVLVILFGLQAGSKPLAAADVFAALIAPDGKFNSILVWVLRLPRSIIAYCAGAGLAISGYLLQSLTRNPLAGPGLTGVTSGAVVPIVFSLVYLPWLSTLYYPLIGLTGGLSAVAVTFWVAGGGSARPLHLALGGITVSLFLGAITTAILLVSGPQAATLTFWLSGGFQGRSWAHLYSMLPWVMIGSVAAMICQRAIGLLSLSDEAAAGMGLRISLWRPVLVFIAALPVAGIAPVAGPVAFVGMAAPHIARLLKPYGPGWALALSAAIGGLMTAASDIVSRSIAAPQELPVGMITALIGGPVFIYLVQRPGFSAGQRQGA